jgi:hypothetical protein
VRDGRPGEVFPLIEEGLRLAEETSDPRAERALVRVRARALRESGEGLQRGGEGEGQAARRAVSCCAPAAAAATHACARVVRMPPPPPVMCCHCLYPGRSSHQPRCTPCSSRCVPCPHR